MTSSLLLIFWLTVMYDLQEDDGEIWQKLMSLNYMSSIMDHAYQFATQKYEILRINKINQWNKRNPIYCRRGSGKEGEKITAENATEF